MIYAVNTKTKKHRHILSLPDIRRGELVVQADADGWIKHDGSNECPLPSPSWCEVYRRPGKTRCSEAWRFNWRDIEMYRPVIGYKDQDMSEQEWDGEGLPPIGCQCMNADGERVIVRAISQSCHDFCVQRVDEGGIYLTGLAFLYPIRTAAQRAEDEAVEAMAEAGKCSTVSEKRAAVVASGIYIAIRDGRIPGVKLDDDA